MPLRSAIAARRSSRSLGAALARTLVLLLVALALPAPAGGESTAEQPRPFEGFAGVPGEWTDVLNGYVYDPATYGPRLIAIERESGGNLPPVFQMAAADAYLRTGNRRAAERIFEQSLTAGHGYPWDDFANLGMGTIRLTSGDEAGAEIFFGRVVEAGEESSRALGNLGLGSALAADGRFAEAKAAFDQTAASTAVEKDIQQAGRFGSATALYGAGDFAAAAKAFDEIAKADPDSPIGRDARYAAARARVALGDRDASASALRELIDACDPKSTTRRAPRALRNLDPRAIGRNWLRNYRATGWGKLQASGTSMYSIGGCSLARSTLRAIERNDPQLAVVQVSASTDVAAARPAAPQSAPGVAESRPAPAAESGPSWLLLVVAALAVATLLVLWQLRGRGARSR